MKIYAAVLWIFCDIHDEDTRADALWAPACTLALFIISIIMFIIVSRIDPGYTKSLSHKEFYETVDRALKEDRSLEYFCFFCRSLWSYHGVHCSVC